MNQAFVSHMGKCDSFHVGPQVSAARNSSATLEAPQNDLRAALAEHLEVLLGRLRGQALLVATLSYGLGVRISQLQTVKVRDVSISDKTVYVGGRERTVPEVILEDLKELMHDRICGFEASSASSRREAALFSAEAFEALAAESRRVDSLFSGRMEIENENRKRARACFDSRLRILGWFHRKRAARKGIRLGSAIELFDKGPRIVRRGSCGVVDAYYLWRAPRVLFI